MNPSKEIINQKLAEYMGVDFGCTNELHDWEYSDGGEGPKGKYYCNTCEIHTILALPYLYTDSLDAQVPVWEKLSNRRGLAVYEYLIGKPELLCRYLFIAGVTTIQHAAALATYKAIIAIEKEGE